MNIKELRINNLISHNGLICTVEIINGELDEIYFLGEDFYHCDKPENLEGVPLTEEWIEEWILTLPKNKLKFNMKREYVFEAIRFIINKYIILTIHNDGIVSLGLLNQSFSIQLKYVHTFQNLYFALTGNELPLNL